MDFKELIWASNMNRELYAPYTSYLSYIRKLATYVSQGSSPYHHDTYPFLMFHEISFFRGHQSYSGG